jgi:hypothetical protein
MRISNDQARQQAMALVESFLKGREQKPGWSWHVVDASPDETAPEPKHRKTWVKWAVVVEWKHNGYVFDGPGVLCVDILARKVEEYEASERPGT